MANDFTSEEIMIPTWDFPEHPTVHLSEIKARRFYIVDRAIDYAARRIAHSIKNMFFPPNHWDIHTPPSERFDNLDL